MYGDLSLLYRILLFKLSQRALNLYDIKSVFDVSFM